MAVLSLSTAFFRYHHSSFIIHNCQKGGCVFLKVNGKDIALYELKTISDLLKELNVNEKRVVVELNKEIVVKEDFGKVNLQDDDTVEVISFVGGG